MLIKRNYVRQEATGGYFVLLEMQNENVSFVFEAGSVYNLQSAVLE